MSIIILIINHNVHNVDSIAVHFLTLFTFSDSLWVSYNMIIIFSVIKYVWHIKDVVVAAVHNRS